MVSLEYGELMDCILKFMVEKGVPLTKENYVEIAYMGNPPELDAEIEAELEELFDEEGNLVQ
jgi:hypothetical protein